MRRLLLVLAALAAALAAAPPAALGKIVVGESIAGVKIGHGESTVRSRLGPPDRRSDGGRGVRLWEYTEEKLVVGLWKHRVSQVYTYNKRERTAKGIGPGSTIAAVGRAYPGTCDRAFPTCTIRTPRTVTQFFSTRIGGRRVDIVKIFDRTRPPPPKEPPPS